MDYIEMLSKLLAIAQFQRSFFFTPRRSSQLYPLKMKISIAIAEGCKWSGANQANGANE